MAHSKKYLIFESPLSKVAAVWISSNVSKHSVSVLPGYTSTSSPTGTIEFFGRDHLRLDELVSGLGQCFEALLHSSTPPRDSLVFAHYTSAASKQFGRNVLINYTCESPFFTVHSSTVHQRLSVNIQARCLPNVLVQTGRALFPNPSSRIACGSSMFLSTIWPFPGATSANAITDGAGLSLTMCCDDTGNPASIPSQRSRSSRSYISRTMMMNRGIATHMDI